MLIYSISWVLNWFQVFYLFFFPSRIIFLNIYTPNILSIVEVINNFWVKYPYFFCIVLWIWHSKYLGICTFWPFKFLLINRTLTSSTYTRSWSFNGRSVVSLVYNLLWSALVVLLEYPLNIFGESYWAWSQYTAIMKVKYYQRKSLMMLDFSFFIPLKIL
jgi:hypothetical protein